MSHKPIELILLRQLADRLALPVVLADRTGALVHVNAAALALFDEAGEGCGELPSLSDIVKLVEPTDDDGHALTPDEMPIAIANRHRRAQQATLWVRPDGVAHRLAVTAIPLDGQGGAPLGAMSIFWEVDGAGGAPADPAEPEDSPPAP